MIASPRLVPRRPCPAGRSRDGRRGIGPLFSWAFAAGCCTVVAVREAQASDESMHSVTLILCAAVLGAICISRFVAAMGSDDEP